MASTLTLRDVWLLRWLGSGRPSDPMSGEPDGFRPFWQEDALDLAERLVATGVDAGPIANARRLRGTALRVVSDVTILGAIHTLGEGTLADIARALDVTVMAVRTRLRGLVDEGVLSVNPRSTGRRGPPAFYYALATAEAGADA